MPYRRMTKQLEYFPIDTVKDLTKSFNKAFHSKIFTLIASSESEIYAFSQRFPQHYQACFSFVKKDEGQWYMATNKIEELRSWVLEQCKNNPQVILDLYKIWQNDWEKYLQLAEEIKTLNLSTLNQDQFYLLFEKFFKQYVLVGSIAYITDCFMSTGTEDWLEELIAKELTQLNLKEKEKISKIRTLTSPVHLSFTLEAEYQLLKAAAAIVKEFGQATLSFDKIKKTKYYQKLKEIEQNFHWIQNNYYNVHYVSAKEFYQNIIQIIQEHKEIQFVLKEKENHLKDIKEKREELISSLSLSKYLKNVLMIARLFAKWKDIRKSGVYIGMYYFDLFLEEVSKRTKYTKEELTFSVFNEINKILSGKDLHKELLKRKEQCFFAVTTEGYFICGGKDANKYFTFNKSEDKLNVTELRGVVAATGYARGRVHIIRKTEEMKTFQTGEILVANQTTPEFVPIMKKAAAIITEQGGITSHAAIVARELKKPCIIGTRIATSALMNGEIVEVDANNGIIRKLR